MDEGLKYIRKRDGRVVPFNMDKITDAIIKAVKAVGGDDFITPDKIAKQITTVLEVLYKGERIPTVENVQDLVEKILIESGYAKVAKAYILYREQHAHLREGKKLFNEALIAMDEYISHEDWRVNENSNMGYSLQGLNNYIASKITSEYWLNKIYPKEIRDAHINGDFHIHDLGLLSVYCCGWDLKDLLTQGFKGAYGKVESAPPKHFRSALGQIVNFFYTLQGESAGAQAFSNFDTYLAPFIRYDNLTYKQVFQSMQEFVFNMNIPTRVGFQTPFSNVTMDMQCPEFMKNEAVIIGGKMQNETYGDFQEEMNMLNKAFCQIMTQGDASGRIFTFPIPTYNISKNFNWDDENYEPVWEMTAKYGVPYFANFINSDMDPEDARSMCCRLRLDNRELRKRGGGLFGSNPLTGSIGVVTINLPRLGYLSETEDEYFKRLSDLMDKAKRSLKIKRKVLENLTEGGLYPYSRFYLRDIKQRFGEYWANHFATIGINGMNESLMNFLKCDISDAKGEEFAIKVLNFMRDKLEEYQKETNELFNLEATPAEGTGYRLAKIDKNQFPKIQTQGEKQPYYTNSTHLPVNYTEDIFDALEHQDKLQTLYTGGTVFHGFLGESLDDTQLCKNLVRKIAENFELPYFTISPTFTICPVHGYIRGEHFECPYDHEKIEITGDELGQGISLETRKIKTLK